MYAYIFSIWTFQQQKMILSISKHVLWCVCVPVWNMPRSDFWWYIVLWPLAAVVFLYCTLWSLSTEFLGNSKWGWYFCSKVWVFFAIFLEAVLKLFLDYFSWGNTKRNENTLNFFEKYYNFIIIIFTVYCYLYLNVVTCIWMWTGLTVSPEIPPVGPMTESRCTLVSWSQHMMACPAVEINSGSNFQVKNVSSCLNQTVVLLSLIQHLE